MTQSNIARLAIGLVLLMVVVGIVLATAAALEAEELDCPYGFIELPHKEADNPLHTGPKTVKICRPLPEDLTAVVSTGVSLVNNTCEVWSELEFSHSLHLYLSMLDENSTIRITHSTLQDGKEWLPTGGGIKYSPTLDLKVLRRVHDAYTIVGPEKIEPDLRDVESLLPGYGDVLYSENSYFYTHAQDFWSDKYPDVRWPRHRTGDSVQNARSWNQSFGGVLFGHLPFETDIAGYHIHVKDLVKKCIAERMQIHEAIEIRGASNAGRSASMQIANAELRMATSLRDLWLEQEAAYAENLKQVSATLATARIRYEEARDAHRRTVALQEQIAVVFEQFYAGEADAWRLLNADLLVVEQNISDKMDSVEANIASIEQLKTDIVERQAEAATRLAAAQQELDKLSN